MSSGGKNCNDVMWFHALIVVAVIDLGHRVMSYDSRSAVISQRTEGLILKIAVTAGSQLRFINVSGTLRTFFKICCSRHFHEIHNMSSTYEFTI